MTTVHRSDLLDIERDIDADRARMTTNTSDPDAETIDIEDDEDDDDASEDEDSETDVARVAREISSDETAIDGSEKGLIYPGPGA